MPIGIAAAIYLQEYARDTRLNRLLTTNIRNLAGVPSIVYGILGLVVFVQALRAVTGPDRFGRSYISGGLTLAVLVLPIIILITMEALRAVPKSIREAAYGVGRDAMGGGAEPRAAVRGTGHLHRPILSLARAFGETAPLLLVGRRHRVPVDPPRPRRSRSSRASTRRCPRRSTHGPVSRARTGRQHRRRRSSCCS